MPPSCTTLATSSRYHPYKRRKGAAVVPAPNEPEKGGRPPSLDEVLAEVVPFLEAIGAREWRDCVRHLVLTNTGRAAQDRIRVDALFRPGFTVESTKNKALGSDYFQDWTGKGYSDERIFPPESSPDIFKDRSIPALIELVDLLLSSGISIEGDFRDILVDDSVGQTLSLGDQVYGGARTPLDAVIKGICTVERMIHEPAPKQVYDQDSIAIQLDYMFSVFEVLMNAGASCWPCVHEPELTVGTLELACSSPWQCGPTSHSGKMFLLLLSTAASVCPDCCELKEAAWMRSTWKVEQFLQLGGGDLRKHLRNVLFLAVKKSAESAEEEEMQVHTIRHIVQAGQQMGIPVPRDILSQAIQEGCGMKVVECLIGLGTQISLTRGSSLKMRRCSVEVVEYLIRHATDVDFSVLDIALHGLFTESQDYLDEAHPVDCLAKLRCLITGGADVNATDGDGQTPLFVYMLNVAVPDVLVVEALLEAGADPNRGDCLYQSLNRANPSPEVTRLLIQYGADVNRVGEYGSTPLHALCYHGNFTDSHVFSQVLRILLDAGADVNAKAEYSGDTPLHFACNLPSHEDLIPSTISSLLAAGANVNAVNIQGSTPLHMAVSRVRDRNIIAAVDLLAIAGARVDADDLNGCTPLHLAALHGNTLAIERLTVVGADAKMLDMRGGGLLHYAACSPYVFPASFLSAHTLAMHRLDVDLRDIMGLSPLHWAARGSHNEANLEAMLNAGADVNARDHQNRTPLHHAARLATPRIAKLLVSAGAKANSLDQQGDTPLTLAARAGSYEGIIELIKAGVSVPEIAIEFGQPLALQGKDTLPLRLLSRLLRMVRFLKKVPTPAAPARQQLQATLLANLHDVYKNYPLRALQEKHFQKTFLNKTQDYFTVHDMQTRMLGNGGFGDCYVGTFFGRSIVSKRLRFYYEREKYMRHLQHEASIWAKLNHQNIIPFIGMPSIDGVPHLMSPLMQNGAADDYVKKNPNVNRVQLLVQIAQGLEHMHTRNPPIIHGDLKANNILISEDGSACVSDFGLSRLYKETNVEATLAASDAPTLAPITMAYHANFRWGAPEVLLEDMHRTPASDIFSLGRLNVELLTGEIPFPGLPDRVIILHVATGRYDRPTDNDAITCGLDDEMWTLLSECWDQDPLRRPSATQVAERLRRMPEPASVNPSWKPSVKAGGDGSGCSSSSMSSGETHSTVDSPMDLN